MAQKLSPTTNCDLCRISSEETAVFNCNYAKGQLKICLGCLTEGIIDIYKDSCKKNNQTENPVTNTEILGEIKEFEVKDTVYGFSCEKCNDVLFANTFPIMCNCGHIIKEEIIKKL